jgi:hypothetical protein
MLSVVGHTRRVFGGEVWSLLSLSFFVSFLHKLVSFFFIRYIRPTSKSTPKAPPQQVSQGSDLNASGMEDASIVSAQSAVSDAAVRGSDATVARHHQCGTASSQDSDMIAKAVGARLKNERDSKKEASKQTEIARTPPQLPPPAKPALQDGPPPMMGREEANTVLPEPERVLLPSQSESSVHHHHHYHCTCNCNTL